MGINVTTFPLHYNLSNIFFSYLPFINFITKERWALKFITHIQSLCAIRDEPMIKVYP
jgi:hypothetical protein